MSIRMSIEKDAVITMTKELKPVYMCENCASVSVEFYIINDPEPEEEYLGQNDNQASWIRLSARIDDVFVGLF